jgi:muconolactone D-isomerase
MEFLVHIRFTFPLNPTAEGRKHFLEEEGNAEKALAALAKKSQFLRAWRVPGRRDMWALLNVRDATELHNLVSALPLWPYMDATVHPLGAHPLDPNLPKPPAT